LLLRSYDEHFENVLFAADQARSIDFDSCGIGYGAYEVAAPWAIGRQPGTASPLEGVAGAGLAHLDLFIATRHVAKILWVVDIARVNPMLRAELDARIERAGRHIRRFLEGGSTPPSRSAAVSLLAGINPKVPPCP
jgi:hypothetical protein